MVKHKVKKGFMAKTTLHLGIIYNDAVPVATTSKVHVREHIMNDNKCNNQFLLSKLTLFLLCHPLLTVTNVT
jgi:hypothetical protein